MLGIGRDDPGVNPVMGSLLRNHILQVIVQALVSNSFLDIEHFPGIDDTHSGLAANHLIPDLVNDIGLDQGLLLNQKVTGLGQFIRIGGV